MVISHFFFMPFYLVYHLFFMVNDLMVLPKTNLLTKTKKQKTQIWLYLFSHAAYKIGFILFYFIFLLGKWAHTYIFFPVSIQRKEPKSTLAGSLSLAK